MDEETRQILKDTIIKLILKDLSKLIDVETDFKFKECLWMIMGRVEFAEKELNKVSK